MLVAHGTETAASARAPRSLCTPIETPLFACAVGARQVAVCGARTRATYRHGRQGEVELSSTALAHANRDSSGDGEAQITATNGRYRYTVFDGTLRTGFGRDGYHDPKFSSGGLVHRAGRTVTAKPCDDDAPIVAPAFDILPEGPFAGH